MKLEQIQATLLMFPKPVKKTIRHIPVNYFKTEIINMKVKQSHVHVHVQQQVKIHVKAELVQKQKTGLIHQFLLS